MVHTSSESRYNSYIIATSPRSGSTLLCDYLKATAVCGLPQSYFHAPSVARWVQSYESTGAIDEDDLDAVFRAAIKVGRGETGVFGLRLQRGSFAYLMEKLGALHPDATSDLARIEAVFGRTAFVHLTREDKLDQAISHIRASQSGLWHMGVDGLARERLSPAQPEKYDATLIAERLAEMTGLDHQWRAWFDRENIQPLTVTYDALCCAPKHELRRILTHLGRDSENVVGVAPTLRKLADATSLQWKTRFELGAGVA